MTTNTTTIYAIESGLTVAGFVLRRGESLILSAAQIEDTKDRDGNTFLALTEAEQIDRWGSVKFGHGEAPAELEAWQDDSLARANVRDSERENALRIVDRATRRAVLKAIDEKYGRPATQFTVRTEPGD